MTARERIEEAAWQATARVARESEGGRHSGLIRPAGRDNAVQKGAAPEHGNAPLRLWAGPS